VRIINVFAGLAAGLMFVGVAAAASNYGSIAYSPETGAVGYSFDHADKQNAINAALNGCYENAEDCVTATTFWNGACGAVAVGENGGWGSGTGSDQYTAQDNATLSCQKRDNNCTVRRFQCTRR
jgi:serine/threonine-protein kinase